MRGRYYLKKVFKFVLFSSAILLTLFTVIFFSLGCSVIYPKKQLLSERLADLNFRNLPLKNPVNIYWNEYAVPYVEAENDEDLAFTLGLLHAHLRSAQLALFKRAAQGRLSEMAGPLANGIDYLLRIIDFGKAAEDIEKNLPPETKAWVGSFVQGLNFYQDNTKVRPPEFALLGLEYVPWTVRDVLTLTRLAGTDVTWLMYFSLLNARAEGAGFSEDWQRLLEIQETDMTSFEKGQASGLEFLSNFLSENSRSGSNSIAISAAKSSNGAAILHNDPHSGRSAFAKHQCRRHDDTRHSYVWDRQKSKHIMGRHQYASRFE